MRQRLALASVLLVAAVVAILLLNHDARNSRAAPERAEAPPSRHAGEREAVAEPGPNQRLCGRVVEDASGAPVAGAIVTAYAFASGRVLTATAAAD